jgi:hypothetical protein
VAVFVQATVRFCPECAAETEFAQPQCDDGHGADCPEWFCVECGYAVLIGDVVRPERLVRRVRGAAA